MTAELIRDLERPNGWWLVVDGSEQSYVDTSDATHLEFEYVQMVAHALETLFPGEEPIAALHLGGGLCTIARWIAAKHGGSRQVVVERSRAIARMSASLGRVTGAKIVLGEALSVLMTYPAGAVDLLVCDVYDGPETVTAPFTVRSLQRAHEVLRPDGVYIANLSDASPFSLAKVVGATMREVFDSVTMLAEPPVLRGRRSGNLVLVGCDRPVPLGELTRRAAGAPVRARVVSGEALADFIGLARAADDEADLPPSGESLGLSL